MTGDERVQGTETCPLKENVDQALKESGHMVKRVFVASRTGKEIPMTSGRDISLQKVTIFTSQEMEVVIVLCPILLGHKKHEKTCLAKFKMMAYEACHNLGRFGA